MKSYRMYDFEVVLYVVESGSPSQSVVSGDSAG